MKPGPVNGTIGGTAGIPLAMWLLLYAPTFMPKKGPFLPKKGHQR